MSRSLRTALIAPAWNEAERIARVVTGVPAAAVDAVFVVDDGSSDETARSAGEAGARVLRHERNRGVGAAIRTGLEQARREGFDVAVVISGAGKSPPGQIPSLLQPILEDRADFVQGSRYVPGGTRRSMPPGRVLGTKAYSLLFSLLVGRRVHDASSGFRAIRLSLLDDRRIDLQQDWLDRYELEPYLLFQSLRHGYRVLEVPTHIEYPPAGRPYTKMQAVTGWWSIFRPVLFLALRWRS